MTTSTKQQFPLVPPASSTLFRPISTSKPWQTLLSPETPRSTTPISSASSRSIPRTPPPPKSKPKQQQQQAPQPIPQPSQPPSQKPLPAPTPTRDPTDLLTDLSALLTLPPHPRPSRLQPKTSRTNLSTPQPRPTPSLFRRVFRRLRPRRHLRYRETATREAAAVAAARAAAAAVATGSVPTPVLPPSETDDSSLDDEHILRGDLALHQMLLQRDHREDIASSCWSDGEFRDSRANAIAKFARRNDTDIDAVRQGGRSFLRPRPSQARSAAAVSATDAEGGSSWRAARFTRRRGGATRAATVFAPPGSWGRSGGEGNGGVERLRAVSMKMGAKRGHMFEEEAVDDELLRECRSSVSMPGRNVRWYPLPPSSAAPASSTIATASTMAANMPRYRGGVRGGAGSATMSRISGLDRRVSDREVQLRMLDDCGGGPNCVWRRKVEEGVGGMSAADQARCNSDPVLFRCEQSRSVQSSTSSVALSVSSVTQGSQNSSSFN